MTSARPPKAAAGKPPPMTLPKVMRSGATSTPSWPHQPARPTRKPVMTSSETSSAPCSAVTRRSASVKPGSGGTTPMLPAAASVMTQAISLAAGREDGLERVDVVVGDDEGLGGHLGGHAGRVGQGEGGDARARADEEGVDVAVVVAGELHDEAAPGEAAGQADGAHRRLGAAARPGAPARPGRPGRRSPRRAAPRSRRACRRRSRAPTASRTASSTRRVRRGRGSSAPSCTRGRRSRGRRRR